MSLIAGMARAVRLTPKAAAIRDSGSETRSTDMESTGILVELYTKDNGKMEKGA